MKILVTGGAGFIGSFIVDGLIKQGHEVTIVDSLVPQVHKKLPDYCNPKSHLLVGDVSDYEFMCEAIKDQEIIFHSAASVGIIQSNYKVRDFVKSNVLGTSILLDLLVNKEHCVKKLIIPSSNTCYGEGMYKTEDGDIFHPHIRGIDQLKKEIWNPIHPETKKEGIPIPTRETTELFCNSIYSLSKRDQEEMALHIGKTYGLPVSVLRYFNVYGPRQSLDNPYTGVSAIFLSRLKAGNTPVIYEDGNQTRDFVSVHDIVSANMAVMKNANSNYEIFNVASGESTSIQNLAIGLAEQLGLETKPKINKEYRKGDIRHCVADISKIKNKIGWSPAWDLKMGLKELIEWSKNQESTDNFDNAQKELEKRGLLK